MLLVILLCSCDIADKIKLPNLNGDGSEEKTSIIELPSLKNNEAPYGTYVYYEGSALVSITLNEDGSYESYYSPFDATSTGSFRLGDNNDLYLIKDGRIDSSLPVELSRPKYDKSADVIVNDGNFYAVFVKEEN